MGVHGPFGAGDDPVVVEDAERPDAHLLGIAISIEREMPARVEPATRLVPDRVGLAYHEVRARSVQDFRMSIGSAHCEAALPSSHARTSGTCSSWRWPVNVTSISGPPTNGNASGSASVVSGSASSARIRRSYESAYASTSSAAARPAS